MAQVGLKDTLALIAKGYSKKEIDSLAAIDEQAAAEPEQDPEPEAEPEPDYKKMYEELLEKNKETEAKIAAIQQDNVHKNSAPLAAEAKEKEAQALNNLVRSFM